MTATVLQCDREALKPCRRCGEAGDHTVIPAGGALQTDVDLWLCSHSIRLGGTCTEDAYLSRDAWNTRHRHDSTREMVEALEHKLRMVVSHATGGSSSDIAMSVNDICVLITQNRNHIYQAGKDATLQGTDR